MSCKVLLLDEDDVSSKALENGLRELGCEVLLIAEADMFGVSRALARIAKEPFDLIVLSADSRSSGGLGVYDRIKRDPKSGAIPIIVVGTDTDAAAGQGARVPPDARIERPIEQNAVVAAMQKCFPWRIQSGVHSRTRIATLPPDAVDDDDALAVEWSDEPAVASGDGKTVESLSLLLAQEKAAHEANVARARQALVAARAAKHAATRKAEGHTARVSKSLRELEELRQQVAETTNEHRAAMDALARDHERTVERLTRRAERESAALAAERAARAALEATRTEAQASPASVKPDPDASALEELRTAHAAELASLREEVTAAALERERTHRASLEEARAGEAAKLKAMIAEGDARRTDLERQLDDARTQGGALGAARSEETAQLHNELAAEKARARDLDEALTQARSSAAAETEGESAHGKDLAGSLEREVARALTLEEQVRTVSAAHAELAALHERTARDLANHRKEQEAAVGRAALAPLLQLRRTEEMYAAAKVAQAAAESVRAADQAEIASARASAQATLDELATLKLAHAAELAALDESLVRMLEQERIAGVARLEEARDAAVRAALEEAETVADARVLAEEEKRVAALAELESKHDAALARANAEIEEKAGELRALGIAHDEAVQADRKRAASARAAAEAEWSERSARDQERFTREIEGERAARAALAEDLAKTKLAHEQTLETERAEATFVLESTEAALEARNAELAAERDRGIARGTALDHELAAAKVAHEEAAEAQRRDAASALAATAAELNTRLAAVSLERDAAAARGGALESDLLAERDARAELAVERDRLLEQIEEERAEHARLSELAATATREQRTRAEALEAAVSAANIAHQAALEAERANAASTLEAERTLGASTLETERAHAASTLAATEARLGTRNAELLAERDAATLRGEALASDLDMARAEGVELARERSRLEAEMASERVAHASLLESTTADAEAREDAAEEKIRDLNARHLELVTERHEKAARVEALASELAAAKVEHLARTEALERTLETERANAAALLNETEARLSTGNAELRAELDAATARGATLENDLEVVRNAGADFFHENERLLGELDAERTEHATLLESTRAAALARETALEGSLRDEAARHAEVAREAEAKAKEAAAVHAELTAAKDAVEKDLHAARQAAEGLSGDLEAARQTSGRLLDELAALRQEHASILERTTADARVRENALAEKLAELDARRVDVVRERDEQSTRASALLLELGTEKAAHGALVERLAEENARHIEATRSAAAELASERERVALAMDAERAEHTRNVEGLTQAAGDRERTLEAKLVELVARHAEVVRERDEESTRVSALLADLGAEKAAHGALAEQLTEQNARHVEASRSAAAELASERERLTLAMDAERADHTRVVENVTNAAHDREAALEEKVVELNARHLEVVSERHEKATRALALEAELEAAKVAHGEALEAAKVAHGEALEAARVAQGEALEAAKVAHRKALDQEKVAYDDALDRESAAHGEALAEARASAAASERLLSARNVELVADRDRLAARTDALENDLAALQREATAVGNEKDRLLQHLEAARAEHASAVLGLAATAREREQALDAQLKAESAQHVEAARDRDDKAARAVALEAELAAVKAAHEQTLDARASLLRDLEAQASEHAAALDRAGVHATQLARAHEEALQGERARAAEGLSSTEATLNARNDELLRERDQAMARNAALATDLEAETGKAAAGARERERLEVELAATRSAHVADTEQRVAAARAQERETEQKLLAAEARETSKLAALSAELEAKRRLDLADERDRQGARRRELEAEHAAALKEREVAHAEVLAKRDAAAAEALAGALANGDAAAAEALAEALTQRDVAIAEALATRDAALAEARVQHEAALAAALALRDSAHEAELAARDRAHVSAIEIRDSAYADSRASIGAEQAEALTQVEKAHREALARVEATHAAALADVQRALAEQTALADSARAQGTSALAAQETLVKSLRKELGAAMGALAAERQRRSMEDVHAKALEKKRSSGNHRAVTPPETEEERPTHPPPNTMRAAGGRPVAHADPRGVLRSILTRSLGTEARAEQVLRAVLGTNGKELTLHGDELLAVLERSLHAELRGQIGEAGAHAVMDEIASVLVARVGAASVRGEDIDHHLTTKPPPPLDTAPITKDMVKPALAPPPPVVRPPGRRSVLVIDRDRMARANVSRALVREGCDVTVRDSCAGLDAACADYDMIVTEVLDVAIDDLIGVFKPHGAPCPVVAWTAAVDAAKTMFNAADIGHVAVLSKEGRADALVAVIRSSIGGASGAPRS